MRLTIFDSSLECACDNVLEVLCVFGFRLELYTRLEGGHREQLQFHEYVHKNTTEPCSLKYPTCSPQNSNIEQWDSKLDDQRCLHRVRYCNKECVPNADFIFPPIAGGSHLSPVKGERAAS